jgi:hypothetical protein
VAFEQNTPPPPHCCVCHTDATPTVLQVRMVSGAFMSTGFFFLCFFGCCAWFGLNGRVRGTGRSKWWGKCFQCFEYTPQNWYFVLTRIPFLYRCPRDAYRPPPARWTWQQGVLSDQRVGCHSGWFLRVAAERGHSGGPGKGGVAVSGGVECVTYVWNLFFDV